MKLAGLHHITMITGDAQRNVDFYADMLGLRLVKKTVNFDAPDAYHLYFGDETGAPGSILTWFEFAGARPGRRRRGDDPHDPARRRLRRGARLLGGAARRERLRDDPRRGRRCASPTTTASGSSSSSPTTATRRCAPSTRRSRPSTRIVGHRGRPRLRAARRRRGIACSPRRSGSATRAAASTGSTAAERQLPLGLRRAGRERRRRAPAPCTTSPGRPQDDDQLAWQRRAADAGGYVTAGAGPRLLPRDLLPRAARHPVRDRDALARLRRRRGPRPPRRGAAPPEACTSTCARSSSDADARRQPARAPARRGVTP